MTNPKHTDISRSGDLVERLRKARVWPDYSQSRVTIETAHEAADRIEALEAEVERLRELLEPFIEAADEADESGLEDSVEAPISCGQCREARAALEDKQ